MFRKRNKDTLIDHEVPVDAFLNNVYLKHEYIIPDHIDKGINEALPLLETLPGFLGIVNVGSTANGSWILRKQQGLNTASDLDFYLIGTSELELTDASEIVRLAMRKQGTNLDGVLNGSNPANFLNLDQLDDYLGNEDEPLLALPFGSYYGKDRLTVQRKVVATILDSDDPQGSWNTVVMYHSQSLSLHHGSFPPQLSQRIFDEFYPEKMERFTLPETPQAMMNQLNKQPK